MSVMTTGGTNAAGYTHRDWRHDVGTVLTEVAAVVADLGVMEASLAEVDAGRTQMRLVRGCQVTGVELLQVGVEYVDATDRRYLPVHEAISAAGGQDEVASTKGYHTAG